jgi:hypothetical protein
VQADGEARPVGSFEMRSGLEKFKEDEREALGTGRELVASDQRNFVRKAMRPMLNAVDAALPDTVTGVEESSFVLFHQMYAPNRPRHHDNAF